MWKKSLINTSIQMVGKITSLGISLVITAWLTRKLGVEGYGSYSLILSIILLLDSLADWGTGVIGIREMSREKSDEGEILVALGWLRTGLAMMAMMIGVGLMMNYSGLYLLREEFTTALGMVIIGSWLGGVGILFQAKLRWGWKTAIEMIYPVSFLILILTIGGGLNLLGIIECYVLARLMALVVAVVVAGAMAKDVVGKWIWSIRWPVIKKLWLASWPMGLYLLIFTSYDRGVDLMMISSWREQSEVAWYGLAYKIYANLTIPAFFLVNSIFPLLVRTGAEKIYKTAKRWLLVGSLMVTGAVWLTAPLLVEIIAGGAFEPAVGILRILALSLPFAYLNHLYGFDLISRGGQKGMLRWGLIALVVNIGLNIGFIPKFGMTAAAVVTVVTEMSMWLMLSKSKRT